MVGALAAAAGFNAVTVFALYVSSEAVHRLYTPGLLWLVGVLLMYWLGRALLLASRRELHEIRSSSRLGLLQNADRLVGVAQALGKLAGEVAENRDHDVRVLAGKRLELLDPEPVTDHPLVGDDVGRALPPSSSAISPKLKPVRSRPRASAFRLARHPDLHADRAAREHEEEIGAGAFADDDARPSRIQRLHDAFERRHSSGVSP